MVYSLTESSAGLTWWQCLLQTKKLRSQLPRELGVYISGSTSFYCKHSKPICVWVIHIPGFPGVLDFLEFFYLFSRPANSLNLAVFVIMSLNPLEIMRSIGRSSKLLSYIIYISPNFDHWWCSLRLLPVTHVIWELPRNCNIRMFNLHVKIFKKKVLEFWSFVLEMYLNVLEFCPDKTLWTLNPLLCTLVTSVHTYTCHHM